MIYLYYQQKKRLKMKNHENFCINCAFAQETYCEKYGECIFNLLIRWREILRYHHNFFQWKMRNRVKSTEKNSASTHIRDKEDIAPIKSDREKIQKTTNGQRTDSIKGFFCGIVEHPMQITTKKNLTFKNINNKYF